MSRRCEMTGVGVATGNRVSHANNKRRHKFFPNLHAKRFWSLELKKFVTLRVTAAAMRTIDKLGLDNFARKQGVKLK